MDRLLKLEPSNRVVVRVEPGQRCYGSLTLRNVMYTMPVAFRLMPLNRNRFTVRPQTGIIAPLATLTVEITYLPPPPPAAILPETAPDSDDSFFLDSVVAPGASVKDGSLFSLLEAVPADWFTAKKKQVFSDSGLSVFFVGSAVLSRLVSSGGMEKVREVLEASDPEWRPADSTDALGQTLLHLAIARKRADLVQLIVEFGADVDCRSRGGRSPLESAAAAGEALIVELLLARGASTGRSSGAPSWSALHHAAAGGHVDVLRILIMKGARADGRTPDGRTALHLAAEGRSADCVAELLGAGVREYVRDGATGQTALHVAAAMGDEATSRVLVEKGCAGLKEARNGAGKTAYDVAAEEGHGKLLVFLRFGEGLAAAARKGEGGMAARAIEMGAAVDGRDEWGWTALMRAGFKGRVNVMKVLIENGAAVDARDEEGYTALHCAVEAGQAEAVEVLVKRGAETGVRTGKGRTAMEIASSLGYAGIVRILSQGGAAEATVPVAPAITQVAERPRKEKVGKARIGVGKEREKEGRKKGGRIGTPSAGGGMRGGAFVGRSPAVATY